MSDCTAKSLTWVWVLVTVRIYIKESIVIRMVNWEHQNKQNSQKNSCVSSRLSQLPTDLLFPCPCSSNTGNISLLTLHDCMLSFASISLIGLIIPWQSLFLHVLKHSTSLRAQCWLGFCFVSLIQTEVIWEEEKTSPLDWPVEKHVGHFPSQWLM